MYKLWGQFPHHDHRPLAAMMPGITAASARHAALAADQPGSLIENERYSLLLIGRPRLAGQPATASDLLPLWEQQQQAALSQLGGTFALVIVDRQADTVLLAIDRIGVHSLAFAVTGNGLLFASRADAVATAIGRELSLPALFDYFYFSTIPAPNTIYQGVEKLLPGQYALFANGKLTREFYWQQHYRDQPRDDFPAMSDRLHGLLRDCVARAHETDATAAFLSGGTDSSTVAGVLSEISGQPAHSYSIGFAASGFDEMIYARSAGQRFGLKMHEYYLQPADILEALPVIAAHYDEPFANESAVPTYFCAKLARADGYRVILAGDGGDEIFGGNSRYAKQKVFEAYHLLPAALRQHLIEPLAHLPGLALLPPARKLQSYLRQANIPLPERLESYNYTYRQPLEQMFSADFLAQIDPEQPLRALQETYDRTDSDSYINRMLHLDMKFTLADNDLRKVNGMCEAAGIEVRYPLLDDAMVDFAAEVPPDWKVKGMDLRWFYRQALRGYLPDEIIDKRKHGFGLPFGIWAKEYAPLREKIEANLTAFKRRGWLQPAYIDQIRFEHMTGHATYFGKMLWVIALLEEWLALRGL